MVKLIFLNKDLEGKVYKLVLEKTTVGRASDNTLVIHDSSVSSHHCEILVNGEEIIICAKDSTNGTYVNDHELRGQTQQQVKANQTIRFGEVEVRVEVERPERDRPDTEMTTVASLKEIEIERRNAARDAEATTHKELGDATNDEENTVLFEKVKSNPAGGPVRPPTHEPLDVIPEPKSISARWITVTVISIVILLILAFVLSR